jgi:biopolymer transport protein ExbD
MAIRFQCPNCSSIRSVHERMSGHEVICPNCDATIKIPAVDVESIQSAEQSENELPAIELFESDELIEPTIIEDVAFEIDSDLEEESPVTVKFAKKELPKDDMDMTPMVDVTFLLLIFFMITASFTTEKALQQQVASDQPSTQPKPDEENETIKILIDEFNGFTIVFPDGLEVEATSKQELMTVFKNAELDGSSENAASLVIDAHEDSIHASVVGALDVGRQYKITNFKVNVVESFD